jgi:hypothetical protein
MSLTVHTLDLGRAATDSTFFVRHRQPGTLVSAPVNGYLIVGGDAPIVVDTVYGAAAICGDIVCDIEDQAVKGLMQNGYLEPQVSNNFGVATRQEIASIKKMLNQAAFVLPGHDLGAKVDNGEVVGRVDGPTVPGPILPLPSPEVTEGAHR